MSRAVQETLDERKCCRSEFKNGKCALENVGRVLDLNSQLNFDIWKQLKLTFIMADMRRSEEISKEVFS